MLPSDKALFNWYSIKNGSPIATNDAASLLSQAQETIDVLASTIRLYESVVSECELTDSQLDAIANLAGLKFSSAQFSGVDVAEIDREDLATIVRLARK